MRTTKGIHVVCEGTAKRPRADYSNDQRQPRFFVIPWLGNSLIGTTDTDYTPDPDTVAADQGRY